MAKKLWIIGLNPFGREVANWAFDAAGGEWDVGGFLAAPGEDLTDEYAGLPVGGEALRYAPSTNEVFVAAIYRPSDRMNLCQDLEAKGFSFATLRHPTAIVGARSSVGAGSILCPGTIITTDVEIGQHAVLNLYTTIGSGAVVGDYCTLSDHCDLSWGVKLQMGAMLGSHATVGPNLQVGTLAVVGAGSMCVRHVPDLATVMGVPAIKIFGHEPIVDDNWQPNP